MNEREIAAIGTVTQALAGLLRGEFTRRLGPSQAATHADADMGPELSDLLSIVSLP